jgi:cell fate regulator YaaT (PSP1 superfamily)
MENDKSITTDNNPFFTRGCCRQPDPYNKNENVFSHGCAKLDVSNWLDEIPLPPGQQPFDCIEVRFKNSRKDFFRMPYDMGLHVGDIIAVEASPGHDIGIISLKGELVRYQMRNKKIDPERAEIKKVYRKARSTDIDKWIGAVSLEARTIFRTREIASRLKLNMKINDVEYQGDSTKAIFYYTAEDRVDFRELIKILADEFRIRIEMRQIGVRQEAGRLGGIGSCGRELCCSTWLTGFQSVTTTAARVQQLSPNPQKLAGQCSKLKCCLNYEYAAYVDALQKFPDNQAKLKTRKGDAFYQKSDVFKGLMWYSYFSDPVNLLAIPIDKVQQIIDDNRKGKMPEKLEDFARTREQKVDFGSTLGQDDLTRFDNDN